MCYLYVYVLLVLRKQTLCVLAGGWKRTNNAYLGILYNAYLGILIMLM